MASKHKLGDVGTNLLFENEKVKIWELVLEPGQSSDWHHHILDYITVGLTQDAKMQREFEDGTTDVTNPAFGGYRYARGHQPHVVTNIGETLHRNILIELIE